MFLSAVKLVEGERFRLLTVCLFREKDCVDSELTPNKTGCDSTDLKLRTNDSSVLKRRKVERAIFGKVCEAEGVSSCVSFGAFWTLI